MNRAESADASARKRIRASLRSMDHASPTSNMAAHTAGRPLKLDTA